MRISPLPSWGLHLFDPLGERCFAHQTTTAKAKIGEPRHSGNVAIEEIAKVSLATPEDPCALLGGQDFRE